MRCPKCQNSNLADASAEFDGQGGDEDIEWMKCFACGWRGVPIMGNATVTDDEFDDGENTGESVAAGVAPGRRHCHAPGRKHRFCSVWPVKGEDWCKKHLAMKAKGARVAVPAVVEPETLATPRPVLTNGSVLSVLHGAIVSAQADIEALERTRAILARQ